MTERGLRKAGMAEAEQSIDSLKQAGNAAFKAKDYTTAVNKYTDALKLAIAGDGDSHDPQADTEVHTLLSNRAAALLAIRPHNEERIEMALADAKHSCQIAMNWSKAYYRLGQALEAQAKLGGAPPTELRPGAPVVVVDLTTAPELNGMRGQVKGSDEEKDDDRYVVQLEGRDKPVRLRRANCRAVYKRLGVAMAPGTVPPHIAAYINAWRRSAGPDRAIEAALQRCGVDPAEIRVELSADEELMDELIDIDDDRLQKVHGSKDGLPQLPTLRTDDGEMVPGSDSRAGQKQMLAMLIAELHEFETKGDYRQMIETAVAAVQMASVLGDAPSTCYLFSQLSTAYLSLREYRKAEAYARTAILIGGTSCPMHRIMSVRDPLAKAPSDDTGNHVPGLAHPRSSYSIKTQCHLASNAYLALGGVLSQQLKMPKAVQAYQLAMRALQRLWAPPGSHVRKVLSGMLSSLHFNIGNQFHKENLDVQAMEKYKIAAALAKEAEDSALILQMEQQINRTNVAIGIGGADAVAAEQAALLAQFESPDTEWASRCRAVHLAVCGLKGDVDTQRQWLRRAMAAHKERGTPIDSTCSICLEDTLNGEGDNGGNDLMFTVCGHIFHGPCLDGAQTPEGTLVCPNCRSPVSTATDPMAMARLATQAGRSERAVGVGGGGST